MIGLISTPHNGLLYYSTNAFLKYLVQETYYDGIHYVWCNDFFDGGGGILGPVAASSNPASIYRMLSEAIKTNDQSSLKIEQQRASMMALAQNAFDNSIIDEFAKQEIDYFAKTAVLKDWRPLVYLIPKSNISPERIKKVPAEKRASFAMEYIIEDLKTDEFEVLEFKEFT